MRPLEHRETGITELDLPNLTKEELIELREKMFDDIRNMEDQLNGMRFKYNQNQDIDVLHFSRIHEAKACLQMLDREVKFELKIRKMDEKPKSFAEKLNIFKK